MTASRPGRAAGVGFLAGVALVAVSGAGASAWRAPVVGAAAGLLASALRALIALGRAEVRREGVPGRAYRAPVAALLLALLLAAVATA